MANSVSFGETSESPHLVVVNVTRNRDNAADGLLNAPLVSCDLDECQVAAAPIDPGSLTIRRLPGTYRPSALAISQLRNILDRRRTNRN
jgi:hypothetical protein